MFTMQRGAGATMARALCQLALDRNADAFEEIRPPTLVSTATLTATGQLPKFADDAYAIERDDLWCIPTAEVPLTSITRGEILDEAELPMRFMAYTPVLSPRGRIGGPGHPRHAARARVRQGRDPRARHRRTGARFARRDGRACRGHDRGARPAVPDDRDLHRRHGPEPPPKLRHRGVRARRATVARGVVDQLVQRLPGAAGEHPLSPLDPDGKQKGTEIVHTLNGSALAVPRVWAAIVENYRQPDGRSSIPEALAPYMRGITAHRAAVAGRAVTDRADDRSSDPGPARPVRDRRPRHRRRGRRPDDRVEPLARRGVRRGRRRAQHDDHLDRRRRRCARRRGSCWSAARTSAGSRSSPTTSPPRASSSRPRPVIAASVQLARPPSPGSGTGHGHTGRRGRERRVLRLATAREPARGVGVAAVEGDRRSRCARAACRSGRGAFRRGRRATPTALGRVSHHADRVGVLAGPLEPPPRPSPLPTRRRHLAHRTPRAVSPERQL